MRRFLDWVMGLAEAMGGPGLFLLSFLDSSFLSFPEVVDLLLIGLVARYPERLLWYGTMATSGSIIGTYVLYALARRGGEAFLRRRLHERHVERAFRVVRKYGILAVAVPSILPPPVPFKMFVLAAGAARVRPIDFVIAVTVGRGIRYFGEGLLAAWYGQAAIQFIHDHGRAITIGLVVVMVAFALTWIWWSRRRRFDSSSGRPV
ncbi:MAG TPA: VTT domain-containing protein [Vicinamibacterales bacterium]|nr:VTT domain-containing protein [Vicinamibacterales bacterium]